MDSQNYSPEVTLINIVDDCLWYVFENLTFKEKVGIARVCKRWQSTITDMMDHNQDYIELKLAEPYYLLDEMMEDVNNSNDKNVVLNFEERHCLQRAFGDQNLLFKKYKFENVKTIYFTMPKKGGIRPLKPIHLKVLFKRLAQLRALHLYHVRLKTFCQNHGDEPFSWEQVDAIIPRLKAVTIHHPRKSDWIGWLSYILTKEKLEELTIKGPGVFHFYFNQSIKPPWRSKELKSIKFSHLIMFEWLFLKIETCDNLREIQFTGIARDENQRIFNFNFMSRFATFRHLKRLSLRFLNIDVYDLYDLRTPGQLSRCFKHGPPTIDLLQELRVFQLCQFTIPSHILGKILNSMPQLRKLSLLYVELFCDCVNMRKYWVEWDEKCPECSRTFIEKIAELPFLSNLVFKLKGTNMNRATNRSNTKEKHFSRSLTELIEADRFSKLRRLKFFIGDYFHGDLFAAFCNAAKKHPKEAFCFKLVKKSNFSALRRENLLPLKPRNLSVVNSRSQMDQDVSCESQNELQEDQIFSDSSISAISSSSSGSSDSTELSSDSDFSGVTEEEAEHEDPY